MIVGKNNHDEDNSIDMNRMSNGHVIKIPDENDSHPSNQTWSSYLSSFISSARPHSSYGKSSSRLTHSKYYQKLVNIDENHTLSNDENNNQNSTTTDDLNGKSTLIDLSSSSSSPSDECPSNETNDKYLFTTEHYFYIFLFTILYFTWFIFIAEISVLHLLIYLILITLYFLSTRTRRFALAILIYLSYLFLYDALHLVPNYTISQVHIEDVYLLEKKIFGIVSQGQLLTLNEYFKLNHQPLLDILTGICYLNW